MKRLTTEEFIKRAKEVHGDKYDYSVSKYKTQKDKVAINCKIHGVFYQLPTNHTSNKQGCPECGKLSKSNKRKKTVNNFIEQASIVHKNKYTYDESTFINMSTKMKIICPKHGIFEQLPTSHLNRKQGCPKCSNRKKKDTGEFIKEAKEVHGNKYDYSKSKYINALTKLIIICPEHGEFLQTPAKHLSSRQGCPKCGGRLKLTKEEFILKSNKIHNKKYKYNKVDYINCDTKVVITCPIHGDFEQTPYSHMKSHGCPKCSKTLKLTTKEFIERANKIHYNKYDYSLIEYINVDTPVKIICSEHGIFEQKSYVHINLSCGCPKCANEKLRNLFSMRKDYFLNKAKKIHKNKYDYSKIDFENAYKNNHSKMKIVCPKHGEFLQDASHHLLGCGCPKCGKIQNGSKTEDMLYKILVDKFGETEIIRQYKDENLYPWYCDFYVKSIDTFIEYNGYWTHGKHFFDENSEADLELLKIWKNKSKKHKSYINVITEWTERDILKRDTAKENNLNYKVFWSNNLSDAKEWLESLDYD